MRFTKGFLMGDKAILTFSAPCVLPHRSALRYPQGTHHLTNIFNQPAFATPD
jgi:hypothetical protein